jgi:Macrocin-O-methyltransferase (TylF)
VSSPVPQQELTALRESYLQLLKLALTGLAGGEPQKVMLQEDGTLAVVPADAQQRRTGADWPVNALTMIGMKRLDNLQRCIEHVLHDKVPGDLIETGVWRGGASMFMRAMLKLHGETDRVVVAADSFEGFPKTLRRASVPPAQEDFIAVSLDEVRENFRRLGLLDQQVQFVQGWFGDTLPALSDRVWSLIRLDGDLYDSTMDALVNLYPRLSPGGYAIIDDYALRPCRQAVEDYRAAEGIDEEVHEVDWTGIYWRKAGR